MIICVVCDVLGEANNGTSIAAMNLINSLREKGHTVRVVCPDSEHKVNSPWNIAVSFDMDMSFHPGDIAGMLSEYEKDHGTGMDISAVSQEIYDYTGGYPFLVSRICQILDNGLSEERNECFASLKARWNPEGVQEASAILVYERNTLFDSLMGKVVNSRSLQDVLETALFSGEPMVYNPDDLALGDALEYGFLTRKHMYVTVSNRFFETRLYNFFLISEETKRTPLYQRSMLEKDDFIQNGHLNMDLILSHFITVHNDIYGALAERFSEEEGRRHFLLYLRPIINGIGHYYIEARTRDNKRMDVVVDFLGERFVIELKIWRGNAYNERGEKQLSDYLDYFRLNRGYMLSYCFNRDKTPGLHSLEVGGKMLVEAVV